MLKYLCQIFKNCMRMCLFCHFDILMFEFQAIQTKWNNKYIKISCLLSADGAGALFYFLFLANFVNGARACFFYFYFNFLLNERVNPKTKESIWYGLRLYYILNRIPNATSNRKLDGTCIFRAQLCTSLA